MPHNKNRGKPLDLVLDEKEVSHGFAEELADGGERDIAIKKQQKRENKKNK